jgi:surface polysaccharide O-acyltransferase-like enzyme
MTENQRIDEINTIAMAIIAFRGFLYSGEFIYEAKDLCNKRSFKSTSLLCLDITFSDLNEYVIILLKRSKTDYNYISVNIIIAVIATLTCPI